MTSGQERERERGKKWHVRLFWTCSTGDVTSQRTCSSAADRFSIRSIREIPSTNRIGSNGKILGASVLFFSQRNPVQRDEAKWNQRRAAPPPHSIVDHGAGNSDAISSVFCFSCARHFYGATNSPRNALEINKRESAERDESLRSRETEIRSIPSTSTHKKKKKQYLKDRKRSIESSLWLAERSAIVCPANLCRSTWFSIELVSVVHE